MKLKKLTIRKHFLSWIIPVIWYLHKNSKKGATLWPLGKKVMKSKRWKRNGCDGIGYFNYNNSDFVLIPSEVGMRQHKLTCTVVIKNFAINLTITAISRPPLWFQNFSHWKCWAWTGLHLLLQPGCFWVDIKWLNNVLRFF